MKSILLFALLGIAGQSAFAQAGSLTVLNSTSCTVYYVITGSPMGTCTPGPMSTVITLAAGQSTTYSNSTAVPGFPPSPSFYLSAARAQSQPASCTTPPIITVQVGEACTGLPAARAYPTYTSSCVLCNSGVHVEWTSAPAPGGAATLKFF